MSAPATTPLHLLLVEDNDDLRAALCDALVAQGHHVVALDCAEAVPEAAQQTQLDLAILDLNLPGEDGLSLAARLRRTQPCIGLIMLTARNAHAEVCAGYHSGADLYLTKPLPLAVLCAAVAAQARRLRPSGLAPNQFRLHVQQLNLQGPGPSVALNSREAAMLAAFVRAPQQQLETWQIAELLAMDLEAFSKAALELHIVRLRKKLQEAGAPSGSIKSRRGLGYQLCISLMLS